MTSSTVRAFWILLSMTFLLAGCGHDGGSEAASTPVQAAPTGTPVTVATLALADLPVTVRGIGHSVAVNQYQIRAPFDAKVEDMTIVDGDHILAGSIVAHLISSDSAAELVGAQARLASAAVADRPDAQRALALAKADQISTEIRAPVSGVVLAHGAGPGVLVAKGDSLLTLASDSGYAVQAEIPQDQLWQVRPGQPAEVRFPGSAPLKGTVHGLMPQASPGDRTIPVWITLPPGTRTPAVGIWADVGITVGMRHQVLVAPGASVMRDDIRGTSEVAVVDAEDKVHWVLVRPGLVSGDRVELTAKTLHPGIRVVTTGQVGLAEGTPLVIVP